MKYYSTNKKAPIADLHKAVVKGLAEDRGLYMPEIIKKLPQDFFDNIEKLSFQEIAYKVADAFFGEDVDAESLKKIVYDTLAFDCPVVEVEPNIYSLELFHGPTLAFKDVGARFMARLLQYFVRQEGKEDPATTGQLLGVVGILYPVYRNHFVIAPDFEQQIFEGKIYAKGRVQIGRMTFLALRFMLTRDFFKTVQKARAIIGGN